MAVKLDQLEPVIFAAFIQGITFELLSPPGIGKSSIIAQTAANMAKKLGAPFCLAVRHLSTLDPTDVAGPLFITKRILKYAGSDHEFESAMNSYPALFPNSKDTVYLPDGTVTTVGEHGEIPQFGIVFLDELRQAAHDAQKPAARFMDERRVGEWDLRMFGGQWSVGAASNNSEDRSGVVKDLAFITNRKMVLQVETNVHILCNYYEDNPIIDPAGIAYIRACPGSVFTDKVPNSDKPFPTPRSFERCMRMLKTMGTDGALDTSPLAVEVANGFLGEGRGPELIGFLRRVEEMVTIDEILEAPKTARVPDRPDVTWAVVQMLSHHVTVDNGMKLITYLQRLPREMQIVGVSSVMHKCPALQYDKAYSAWAAANKDLLMAAFAADRRNQRRG